MLDCELISFAFSGIFMLSYLRRLLVNAFSCVADSIVYCNTQYTGRSKVLLVCANSVTPRGGGFPVGKSRRRL